MKTKFDKKARKTYKKTFIDPKILKYTREFTKAEIKEWGKEDAFL